MSKDIDKRNHFIHFIEKWLVIALILFVVVQLTAITVIDHFTPEEQRLTKEEKNKWSKDYIGHWYNGTFFISMLVEDHFSDMDSYEMMRRDYEADSLGKFCVIAGTTSFVIGLALIIIAMFRERKKKLLESNTPIIIASSGFFFLLFKIFEELDYYVDTTYYAKYASSFLKTVKYYPMVYSIFIIPVLLTILGLILRQFQKKKNKQLTKNNELIIKIILGLILVVGLGFILYRFGIRLYELYSVNNNEEFNIRIPFYYFMVELPRSYALNNVNYIVYTMLRFNKDLLIFISSFVSIILFVNIILSYIKGEVLTKKNKIRYRVIFISLLVSSLLFNILGLMEVSLLHDGFKYPFNEATYTIALRSLTEPLLYGLFIYIFKHYVELSVIKNKK